MRRWEGRGSSASALLIADARAVGIQEVPLQRLAHPDEAVPRLVAFVLLDGLGTAATPDRSA